MTTIQNLGVGFQRDYSAVFFGKDFGKDNGTPLILSRIGALACRIIGVLTVGTSAVLTVKAIVLVTASASGGLPLIVSAIFTFALGHDLTVIGMNISDSINTMMNTSLNSPTWYGRLGQLASGMWRGAVEIPVHDASATPYILKDTSILARGVYKLAIRLANQP